MILAWDNNDFSTDYPSRSEQFGGWKKRAASRYLWGYVTTNHFKILAWPPYYSKWDWKSKRCRFHRIRNRSIFFKVILIFNERIQVVSSKNARLEDGWYVKRPDSKVEDLQGIYQNQWEKADFFRHPESQKVILRVSRFKNSLLLPARFNESTHEIVTVVSCSVVNLNRHMHLFHRHRKDQANLTLG